MPTVTITINAPFTDATIGAGGLVLSPAEFKEQYLWGIPLCNPTTGVTFTDETFRLKIMAAQEFIEQYLGLKLFKQYVTEHKDFVLEEFRSFGYIQCSYPVNKIYALNGKLNQRSIIQYPLDWLNISRSNMGYSRNLQIVPNGASGGAVSFDYLAVSNMAWFSMFGSRIIPNYWNPQYLTGFDQIPLPIVEAIAKTTAVMVLPIIEQVVVAGSGAYGAASSSISMDGLSQSVSKANGGNIFQQRLRQYGEELMRQLPQLRSMYVGIPFNVV